MRVKSQNRPKHGKHAKRVRFKLAWQTYSVGDVIEPHAMLRDWLINSGYCDLVEPESEPEQEMETATIDPVAETTAVRSARSPKGQRHKYAVRT